MSIRRSSSPLILFTLIHAGSCRDYTCYDTATCPILVDAGPTGPADESADGGSMVRDGSMDGIDARDPADAHMTSREQEGTSGEGEYASSGATTDPDVVSASQVTDAVDMTTDAVSAGESVGTTSSSFHSPTEGQAQSSGETVESATTPGAVVSSTGGEDSEGPPPEPPEPTLVTSGPGAYWQVGEVADGSGSATITVNESQTHQEWHGFGGTFNEAGWDALLELSEADRERAIKLLFDKQEGAAFTYGRIPVGSSDYGLDRYSLQATQGGAFSIARDRQHLIPYIKAALAVTPDLNMWASPWSPPPWMKSNNAFDGGTMLDAHFGAHAEYLVRFVEEYAKEGIEVQAVHPQSEPGYQHGYPSCGWTPTQMTTYIGQHLGPLLSERLPATEIWLGTMSNTQVAPGIVSAVMSNATARGYVKGIGLQWGMVAHAANYADTYGVPIMQTEHQGGNYPWETGAQPADANAPNDHAYGQMTWDLLKGWITNNVNSYSAWNMVLDTSGRSLDNGRVWHQNALLVVDRAEKRLIETPAYYVFRHFSQYVHPGAVRVGTQGGNAVAFKNSDGSVVTIMANAGAQAAQTTLSANGKTVRFSIPANGWATVNLKP